MLLVVDIGNSSITFGVFAGEILQKTFRTPSNCEPNAYKDFLKENAEDFQIENCIISSVAGGVENVIKSAVDDIFGISSVIMSADMDFGFDFENKKEAGADRVANVAAARTKYKLPVIVVDMGTATTFDIVDKNGEFIGGLIMPGVRLQLESLSKNTAKLPLVEIKDVEKTIANNTLDSILSGVISGHASAIDGLLAKCKEELGETPTVVATGGYSKIITKYIRGKIDFLNPNLTLEGLKIIFEKNQ